MAGVLPFGWYRAVSNDCHTPISLLPPQMDALSVDIEQLTAENAALSEVIQAACACGVALLLCHTATPL